MKINWKDYEIYIHKHLHRLFPDAVIRHNVNKIGALSKTKRQIDIYVEGKLAGFDINIVVECKYFNKKIDVKDVETFISFLHDLKASKGILITNKGYSTAAYNRAFYDTRDVELRILEFGALEASQSLYAIVYAGPFCILLSAPPGWLIDANTFEKDMVATLFPYGLTKDEAFQKDGFIYLKFSKKDGKFPDLQTLTKTQDNIIKKNFPAAKIEYKELSLRNDANVLLRTADIDQCYNGLEYTAFIDFSEFILFIVLLAPHLKDKEYFRKLTWIIERLIPSRITDSDSTRL